MKNITILFMTGVLGVLFLTGCGSNAPFKGKVVCDDGSIVPSGMVTLTSEKLKADGLLKPDGTFSVGVLKDGAGVPPGKYRVTFGAGISIFGPDEPGSSLIVPVSPYYLPPLEMNVDVPKGGIKDYVITLGIYDIPVEKVGNKYYTLDVPEELRL